MTRRTLSIFALAASACGGDARVVAPHGASDFSRFVVVGTGFSMGELSAGVVYETQLAAWPARLAARVNAPFRVPSLRDPGCTPPLVAPLGLNRNLAGTVIAGTVSCNGKLGVDTLPANAVAMSGATAWDALHTTPRSFVTAVPSLDQTRYPLVLPSLQTQLQSAQAQHPTLVAVELGASEVMRAATSGLVTVATGYTQKTAWTLMPAAAFIPVFDSIADSVAAMGARAVFVGVPQLMSLPTWRTGDILWQQRTALATYGVTVVAGCQGSTNLLNTVALLPPLVAAARAGTPQTLSCADTPGQVDFVLTAADAALITQTVTAINAAIKAAADKRQFAYVDVPLFAAEIPFAAPTFTADAFLGSDSPFGLATSLDGIYPSPYGHELMADAVAAALNTKYGWSLPIPVRPK